MKTKNQRFYRTLNMLLSIFMILTLIMGCTKKIYVPIENYHAVNDSSRRTIYRCDSILFHDSITTFIKGDSVIKTIVRQRDRIKIVTDTIHRFHRDTIMKNIPIYVKTSSNYPTFFSKVLTQLKTKIADLIILLTLLILLYHYLRKKHSGRS